MSTRVHLNSWMVAAIMLLFVACSDTPEEKQYPLAADLAMTPSTATVTIDAITYEYGCPDFPCPVTALVRDHIDRGMYMWLEPGTFPGPAIYLYALQTPVKLRYPTVKPPDPPPFVKILPTLNGPDEMMGTRRESSEELTCENVQLQIASDDGRDWMFISGERELAFMEWNYATEQWVPTGATMKSNLFQSEWPHLEGGFYDVRPGIASKTYDVTFSATVETGNEGERHVVSHTFRCMDPEQPEPLPPYLTGPEMVRGDWITEGPWWHTRYRLICRDFSLDLVSPDGGPWAFDEGTMVLSYLEYNSHKHRWEPRHGSYPMTITLGSDAWEGLLGGDYTIVPNMTQSWFEMLHDPLEGYRATVTATVGRTTTSHTYSYEVTHNFICVDPGLYDWLNR